MAFAIIRYTAKAYLKCAFCVFPHSPPLPTLASACTLTGNSIEAQRRVASWLDRCAGEFRQRSRQHPIDFFTGGNDMKSIDLRGLVPAPVTPFTRDGAVDHAAIQHLGSW